MADAVPRKRPLMMWSSQEIQTLSPYSRIQAAIVWRSSHFPLAESHCLFKSLRPVPEGSPIGAFAPIGIEGSQRWPRRRRSCPAPSPPPPRRWVGGVGRRVRVDVVPAQLMAQQLPESDPVHAPPQLGGVGGPVTQPCRLRPHGVGRSGSRAGSTGRPSSPAPTRARREF